MFADTWAVVLIDLLSDATFYRKLVSSFVYLTITCPDFSYVVNLMSQFMNAPCHHHLVASNVSLDMFLGLLISDCFTLPDLLIFKSFCYADWVGRLDNCRLTIGWCMYLADALISWQCKNRSAFLNLPPKLNVMLCLQLVRKLFSSEGCYWN